MTGLGKRIERICFVHIVFVLLVLNCFMKLMNENEFKVFGPFWLVFTQISSNLFHLGFNSDVQKRDVGNG